jgi:hypothetical protein
VKRIASVAGAGLLAATLVACSGGSSSPNPDQTPLHSSSATTTPSSALGPTITGALTGQPASGSIEAATFSCTTGKRSFDAGGTITVAGKQFTLTVVANPLPAGTLTVSSTSTTGAKLTIAFAPVGQLVRTRADVTLNLAADRKSGTLVGSIGSYATFAPGSPIAGTDRIAATFIC